MINNNIAKAENRSRKKQQALVVFLVPIPSTARHRTAERPVVARKTSRHGLRKLRQTITKQGARVSLRSTQSR